MCCGISTLNDMHILLILAVISPALSCTRSLVYQCACATSNLHLRHGPGTSYDVITTLTSDQCLPYQGLHQAADDYTWFYLEYNHGQGGWAASKWLSVHECSDIPTQQQFPTNDVQLPGCPRIVTRAEWGARDPAGTIGHMTDVPIYVFIHHGASSPCFDEESCKSKVRGYQNFHIDGRGWSDIGYNFVVGEDGNAYEGRGWSKIGAHTRGYNSVGIAISFIGNFMDHVPNDAALSTARQLITCGLANGVISPSYTLKGHRDVGSTACPGDALYQLIHSWPHFVAGHDLYSSGAPVG